MTDKPPKLSYEGRGPRERPLAAWYHVAVTVVLACLAAAILLYWLAGLVFRLF